MMTATYFGEITELDSRAVWYSDEEDEEDEEEGLTLATRSKLKTIEPLSHETVRAGINFSLERMPTDQNLKFSKCIISLSSSSKFKSFKSTCVTTSHLLGHFGSFGKAFAHPIVKNDKQTGEFLLWLLFDSTNQYIVGHEVSYFVEALLKSLQREFNFDHSSSIFILSQQFSSSEQLEYLTNYNNPSERLPFTGKPILPPSLIKNQFESALFEQSTLSMKPAIIVCLPNPKNFWFDRITNWPSVPGQIIELKLNDDNLEKTLIFT